MGKISYDNHGYLTPQTIIPVSEDEFVAEFVTRYPATSSRSRIHPIHQEYNQKICTTIGQGFAQLVDGSFTTTKGDPGDVDVMNVIPYPIYLLVSKAIDSMTTQICGVKYKDTVHSFLVFRVDPGTPHKDLHDRNYKKWLDWFTKDKLRNKKGIVELTVVKK